MEKIVKYFGELYMVNIDPESRQVVAEYPILFPGVKGKAKCSPEDTFDQEIGMQIALNRCALKRVQRIMDTKRYQLINTELNLYDLDNEKARLEKEKNYLNLKYETGIR